MTAIRVISDHNELENSGVVGHAVLDTFVASTPFLVPSGSSGFRPPGARELVAGDGVSITDAGPGRGVTIGSTAVLSGSPIVTSYTHETLRQLVHFIKEGPGDGFYTSPYRETVGRPFVERVTWWDSSNMDIRLFQTEYTRSISVPVATEVRHKLYNSDGSLAITAIDTIAYISGVFEASRTRRFV